ncbi:hypothetical protein F5888DRAFT_1639677 [Russula emetica]|nr:hypothetical protein F5888DRAFT_1639677 [Russula emetica]
MDSPTFHPPVEDAGTPEHGEHSEREDGDIQLVPTRAQKKRVNSEDPATAIQEMINHLKSIQSDFFKAHVENWLKCAGELQRKELEKSHGEFDDELSETIEESLAVVARVEFGISKLDAQCDIAEQIEAIELTKSINWMSDKICEDARRLCIDSGHFITQAAIECAESLSKEMFAKLSRHRVEGAHSNLQDGVRKAYEFQKVKGEDIINRQRILIEKLSQTQREPKKVTYKKTIEKTSQTEPNSTRKRTINPLDKQTEVASRRCRKVHDKDDKEGKVVHQECETQQLEGSHTTQQQEASNQGLADLERQILTQKGRQAQVMTGSSETFGYYTDELRKMHDSVRGPETLGGQTCQMSVDSTDTYSASSSAIEPIPTLATIPGTPNSPSLLPSPDSRNSFARHRLSWSRADSAGPPPIDPGPSSSRLSTSSQPVAPVASNPCANLDDPFRPSITSNYDDLDPFAYPSNPHASASSASLISTSRRDSSPTSSTIDDFAHLTATLSTTNMNPNNETNVTAISQRYATLYRLHHKLKRLITLKVPPASHRGYKHNDGRKHLQLPTEDANVAMGGEPSANPHQLERLLVKISNATDRNTKLMELLISLTMPAQPGATGATMHAQPGATEATMPVSTPEDSSDETTLLTLPKNIGRHQENVNLLKST